MEGYICHFNPNRHFGFIARKLEGGWLEKYFFLETSIIRKEVEPNVNGPVVFDLDTEPRRQREGGLPVAANVQVLEKKMQDKAGV
jgi:hypothetical protein